MGGFFVFCLKIGGSLLTWFQPNYHGRWGIKAQFKLKRSLKMMFWRIPSFLATIQFYSGTKLSVIDKLPPKLLGVFQDPYSVHTRRLPDLESLARVMDTLD